MHSVDEHKAQNSDRRERTIGATLLVVGLMVAAGAMVKIHRQEVVMAQADSRAPTQAAPDQTRPTTPPPEPARPQAKPGETTGAAPLTTRDRSPEIGTPLPPAPAEKFAPPINRK